jgi:hypothetical protein
VIRGGVFFHCFFFRNDFPKQEKNHMYPATLLLSSSHGLIALVVIAFSAISFGTFITAQTQGPLLPSNSPDADTVVGAGANLPAQFEILTGTTDVITGGGGSLPIVAGDGTSPNVPICGTSFIETAAVDATTLAAPVAGAPSAGGNDGLQITIVDNSGHAHTVTCPANAITPAHHLVTFGGTQGAFVILVARNGKWIPLGQSGVTIT